MCQGFTKRPSPFAEFMRKAPHVIEAEEHKGARRLRPAGAIPAAAEWRYAMAEWRSTRGWPRTGGRWLVATWPRTPAATAVTSPVAVALRRRAGQSRRAWEGEGAGKAGGGAS
jgi:hypothetical protein